MTLRVTASCPGIFHPTRSAELCMMTGNCARLRKPWLRFPWVRFPWLRIARFRMCMVSNSRYFENDGKVSHGFERSKILIISNQVYCSDLSIRNKMFSLICAYVFGYCFYDFLKCLFLSIQSLAVLLASHFNAFYLIK